MLVEGQRFYLRLSKKDCDSFFEKWFLNEKNFVEPSESKEWIKNSIVGNITKEMLDNQRIKEQNGNDLMQNTSVIYHIESVLEMQMIGLACATFFAQHIHLQSDGNAQHTSTILYSLAVEHIFAYACDYFRKWEIKYYGQLDMHGVYRGKRESYL